MKLKHLIYLVPAVLIILYFSFSFPVCKPDVLGGAKKPEDIVLPDGFEISYFAEDIDNPRSLCMGDDGTIYVGSMRNDHFYALRDTNDDYVADLIYEIGEDLDVPNGIAFKDGDLYVAEVSRILKYPGIASRLDNPPAPVVVTDKLPTERSHGWKYIAFGPDGNLYVPVGAPGNIVERLDDERFASILQMDPETGETSVYAHGVRNTVGFHWNPTNGELWFTDNGRDWLGDDAPNDELNHAPTPGMHFGYPYCHEGEIADPDFGDKHPCSDFVKPAAKLGPHVAALGMKFYTGDMFPEEYKGKIFVCLHGSWNRSTPIGYEVVTLTLGDTGVTPDRGVSSVTPDTSVRYSNRVTGPEKFASGWLKGNSAWGRPVDVLQLPDGSILISDDHGDAIYRITYNK